MGLTNNKAADLLMRAKRLMQPVRGQGCSTECLGTCDDCKLIAEVNNYLTTTGDVIGGFPVVSDVCFGCGKKLEMVNAWMTDGCPCNSKLGCNSMNETRWRLLMQLQQDQSRRIEKLEALAG